MEKRGVQMKSIDEIVEFYRSGGRKVKTDLNLYEMLRSAIRKSQANDTFIVDDATCQWAFQNGPVFLSMHPRPQPIDKEYFHNHAHFELIYVYRGTCHNQFWKCDEELLLNEGDVLLLNPHTPHAPYTLSDEDCVFNILISIEGYEQIMQGLLHSTPLFSNVVSESFYQIDKARDYLYFPANPQYPVKPFVEQLLNECLEKPLFCETMTEHLAAMLIVQLARVYYQEHSDLFSGQCNQLVGKMISYLAENASTVTLKELSHHFGYTPEYISRLFKKATGKSYGNCPQV